MAFLIPDAIYFLYGKVAAVQPVHLPGGEKRKELGNQCAEN